MFAVFTIHSIKSIADGARYGYRATKLHFLYRQLFVTPPPLNKRNDNLRGKTAIVTGANCGIGLAVAQILIDLDCNVILAVRNESKGQEARRKLLADHDESSSPAPSIQVWTVDLSDYDSITTFAERCKTLETLDIAILNAGVYKCTEGFHPTTGFEDTMQINYLANILLMLLLLPIIKEKRTRDKKGAPAGPGKICLISSDLAAWAKFREKNAVPLLFPAFKQSMAKYDGAERYGTTKLLGQLFVTELTKRVSSSAVTISCGNPGLCGSELLRDATGWGLVGYRVMVAYLARESLPSGRARSRTLLRRWARARACAVC